MLKLLEKKSDYVEVDVNETLFSLQLQHTEIFILKITSTLNSII